MCTHNEYVVLSLLWNVDAVTILEMIDLVMFYVWEVLCQAFVTVDFVTVDV